MVTSHPGSILDYHCIYGLCPSFLFMFFLSSFLSSGVLPGGVSLPAFPYFNLIDVPVVGY